MSESLNFVNNKRNGAEKVKTAPRPVLLLYHIIIKMSKGADLYMIYKEHDELTQALDANLYNIIDSLLNTAKTYKDTDLNIPRQDATLLIIAHELCSISESLKSIDEQLRYKVNEQ